ncbi:lipid A deacylase LpxR family protein [Marinoscillum sp. MHG1-6]|uniref:lipid A deacylase LpxR family protein n=1 Tax=Marinoscillum sp. MHG1-6 TaxID=2959627 RepID=UPI00215804C9|nr:lipid A deacylase LpxR family protein [Marinoscillum sp. MHG1-6]
MKNKLLFAFFIGLCFTASSQGKILKLESHLVLDNDLFTGNLYLDQYYSSGIYPSIRFLGDSVNETKVIRSLTLHHRLYTPRILSETDPKYRDRPYAGVFSGSFSNEYYFESANYMKARLELGWLGPHSGVGAAQKAWHRTFGLIPPNGWEDEIRDSPVINMELTGVKQGPGIQEFDLAHEATIQFGTVYNFIRYNPIIRGGIIRPYHQSVYTNGVLGSRKADKAKIPVEAFFFYSPGLELVIYNATLQGNLIGKPSPFTVDPTRLVWQQRIGFMASWSVMDLAVVGYWRRRENIEARTHNYIRLVYNQRF